jgi:hypothetical protein
VFITCQSGWTYKLPPTNENTLRGRPIVILHFHFTSTNYGPYTELRWCCQFAVVLGGDLQWHAVHIEFNENGFSR